MAVPKKFRRPSSSAGQKITAVNNAMGVKGIGSQQGTTRVIFDAVKLATSANPNVITLFQNCKTRQFPLTNLSENKLQVAEAMAMERFSIFVYQCTTDTTNVIGVAPLSYHTAFQRLYASVLNFQIAQDTVIKNFPLTSMFSVFNKDARFMGSYQSQAAAGDLFTFLYSQDVYKFDNDIVITPQIEFVATLQIPPVTLPAGYDFYLGMKIEGLGSLYAPKSTY